MEFIENVEKAAFSLNFARIHAPVDRILRLDYHLIRRISNYLFIQEQDSL